MKIILGKRLSFTENNQTFDNLNLSIKSVYSINGIKRININYNKNWDGLAKGTSLQS